MSQHSNFINGHMSTVWLIYVTQSLNTVVQYGRGPGIQDPSTLNSTTPCISLLGVCSLPRYHGYLSGKHHCSRTTLEGSNGQPTSSSLSTTATLATARWCGRSPTTTAVVLNLFGLWPPAEPLTLPWLPCPSTKNKILFDILFVIAKREQHNFTVNEHKQI